MVCDSQELEDKQLMLQGAAIEKQLAEKYRSDWTGTGINHDRTACSAVNPLSSDVVKVTHRRSII